MKFLSTSRVNIRPAYVDNHTVRHTVFFKKRFLEKDGKVVAISDSDRETKNHLSRRGFNSYTR